MLLDRISKVNKQLKKSLAGGVKTIDETLRLMRESQPTRRELLPRISDPKLRATYNKNIQNIQQLLDKKPRGQSGQAEIDAALRKADKIFSS